MEDLTNKDGVSLWRGMITCPKCAHRIFFVIGDQQQYESFKPEEKVQNCSHCNETFKLYCHPCYFCGEKAWNIVKASSIDIYLCFDHKKEYDDNSEISTHERTGETTYPAPSKIIEEMLENNICKQRKLSDTNILVNEFRSSKNWRVLVHDQK